MQAEEQLTLDLGDVILGGADIKALSVNIAEGTQAVLDYETLKKYEWVWDLLRSDFRHMPPMVASECIRNLTPDQRIALDYLHDKNTRYGRIFSSIFTKIYHEKPAQTGVLKLLLTGGENMTIPFETSTVLSCLKEALDEIIKIIKQASTE